MSAESRTVLVTGGAGYIGAHACKALAAAGYLPVTYDNLVYGHERAVRWGPLERGDILDRARLDEAIVRHHPTAIMHFAAFAYVGECDVYARLAPAPAYLLTMHNFRRILLARTIPNMRSGTPSSESSQQK